MQRILLLSLSYAVFMTTACASSDSGPRGGGGIDAGGGGLDSSVEAGTADAGRDAASADTGATPDAGFGPGSTCQACETRADCMVGYYCAPLPVGGNACLPSCNPDIPDCPPRFDCVADLTAGIPEPVCAPVGERCCVDADNDLHGEGVGCMGSDCDDDDNTVHSSAMEICDGLDNDCDGMADDGDPACPRGDHVAVAGCESGACTIAMCEPAWDDCDGDPATGCETPLTTPTDCGTCGTTCAPPNATGDCSGGTCGVGVCDGGWGDCNGMACGAGCNLARASETCASGTCSIASCDPGWGDCDTLTSTGCETSLRTNADCGACGSICSPTRGTGDCSTGMCRLSTCDSGWGDCDLMSATGCETSLRTNTDCAACGVPCSRAGGTSSCASGSCLLSGCNAGFANCDGNDTNGCEVQHSSVAGSCGANHVGTYDGDRSCGFVCGGNTSWNLFATRTGLTSAWFAATVREDSDCPADIEHRIRLTVPPGTDYDLYVYRPCGTLIASSRAGTGAADSVVVSEGESSGSDDTFTYYVEVRHFSGSSCTPWTLSFDGHNC
jgi:hypothetical protein